MASNYKVLGQVAPSSQSNTDVYTVPASGQAVVSTIVIANRSSTDASYRIAVRPGGASISNEHYVAYDVRVRPEDSTGLTLGVTMNSNDVMTVWASDSNLSFSVFGLEIT